MSDTQAKPRPSHFPNALAALRVHWPLYLMEAAELAAFMISACAFTVLLFHPASPVIGWDPALRCALIGLAMGLTAVGIILSPIGKRSGAHFNPAITCVFYRMGKIGPYDAAFYVVAHFIGAIAGVGLSFLLLGHRLSAPQVDFAVTVPGPAGVAAAFAAEAFMAVLLMAVVLISSGQPKLAPFTPWFVGILIVNYVFFFAPISGFSINPARTVGSAVFANLYTALWIYFTAPLLGMFAAAEAYVRFQPTHPYFGHRHLTAQLKTEQP